MRNSIHRHQSVSFLICILFLSGNMCYAQKKEVPGYYVSTGTDTIRGTFINYNDWAFNPDQIMFIKTGSAEKTILTPDNCLRLRIEGYDDYVSFAGERLTNPTGFAAAVHDPDSTKQYTPVKTFLRVVFANENFSLLEYNDKLRANYYVQKKNEPVIELLYYQYNDLTGNVVERNLYKSQLQELLVDYIAAKPKMGEALEYVAYDDDQLASYFSKVTGTNHRIQRLRSHTQFFITLALNTATVKEENQYFSLSNSLSPVAGIGFIDYGRRNFGRSFFSVSLKVSHLNSSAFSKKVYLKAWMPEVSFSPGYFLIHKKNISWYASLALGGLGCFSTYAYFITAGYDPNAIVAKSHGQKINFLVAPQTGVTFNKKIDAFVNYYLHPTHLSFYNDYRVNMWSIGVNYKLIK